ncbi:cobalamin biosynthesis protein [Caldivirga maquilingensis]|uniref:Probable cobalamin biosynthesis protein CobD n=1 Tax=Caldivirga maquilingensis (strain ATCC 700844 / DSM 13496 / JCM 10307 / IC-167) TaxID=397948 RepID=A8MCQ2_CALMQ|nr:cobalamin biosynthesis protein [Caldivirga maquilingensis]ABW01558.1 cobalamin biosynthesis protein CbiB [Caldivirga maquilingensis IC-167]
MVPYLLVTLTIALIMDYLYPMHKGLLYLIHPVHLTYGLAVRLYRPYSGRLWGVAVWFSSVTPILLIYSAPIISIPLSNPILLLIILVYAGFIVKLSISLRLLLSLVEDYGKAINEGYLNEARGVAQQLVRRNVWVIDIGHVNSAVVESLFESLVDGFTSPLFYLLLFGPIGALLQRLSNTMDSALGYTDEPYRRIGWFSAKVDTAMNYAPARLTALLIVLAGFLMGRKPRLSTYLKYRSITRSLNAGHPLAAASSVLGVRLEKINEYSIGNGELPDTISLLTAIKLAKLTAVLFIIILILCLILIPSSKYGLIGSLIKLH